MTPKDWTLLVIAARNGSTIGPVYLQKSLFLLSKRLSKKDLGLGATTFYKFDPYDYGPFCATIYQDADDLRADGLITIDRGAWFRAYGATKAGLDEAKKLEATLKPDIRNYLHQVVDWACNLSFKQLVSAIYQEYPDMRANSIFRD